MSAMERRDCSRKRYRFLNLYCILEIKAAIMSSSIVVVIISIKWLCEKMKQVAWTDESAEDYSAILLTALWKLLLTLIKCAHLTSQQKHCVQRPAVQVHQ